LIELAITRLRAALHQTPTTDGTESTTAVTLTWHGRAAAVSTYTIQVNCK